MKYYLREAHPPWQWEKRQRTCAIASWVDEGFSARPSSESEAINIEPSPKPMDQDIGSPGSYVKDAPKLLMIFHFEAISSGVSCLLIGKP